MPTSVTLDADLLAKARTLTGLRDNSAVVDEALKVLVERESARLLARLGGTEPDLLATSPQPPPC